MPEIFRYGVNPRYPETTDDSPDHTKWHEKSTEAAEDVLNCFAVGATEVNIRIVKKEAK
jgi:hypothetical protein